MPESPAIVHVAEVDTPIGEMLVAATDTDLLLLEYINGRRPEIQLKTIGRALPCVFERSESPVLATLRQQLAEYFGGKRRTFEVPLRIPGTPFQTMVWSELRRIPIGTTTTYSRVAQSIGRPSAVRAVASANGANRIAIIIPCHRVIGSDGSLTGYGGGLWRKEKLLDLERQFTP